MLEHLTPILVCQLAGEFAVSTAGVPFPGPVAGMILLFVFLLLEGGIPDELSSFPGPATLSGRLQVQLSRLR